MVYSVVAMIADGTPDVYNYSIHINDVILPAEPVPVILNRSKFRVGSAMLTKDESQKIVIAHIIPDSDTMPIIGKYPHLGGNIGGSGQQEEEVMAMSVGFTPAVVSLNDTPNPDRRIGKIE